MRDIEYGIVYQYLNGANAQELGFLESNETEPDITKLPIAEDVWCVQIGFTQPLEHELVLAPGAIINPENERWAFHAMYFPHAEHVTYQQMCMEVGNGLNIRAATAIEQLIDKLLVYGVNYADYDVDVYGRPLMKRDDMIFVRTKADTYAVLSENAAILTPASENKRGVLWNKKSPFLMRNNLTI